jgi:hypothetical protein
LDVSKKTEISVPFLAELRLGLTRYSNKSKLMNVRLYYDLMKSYHQIFLHMKSYLLLFRVGTKT